MRVSRHGDDTDSTQFQLQQNPLGVTINLGVPVA